MAAVCLAHLASQPLPPTAYKQLSDFLLTMSRDEDTKEASGSARQPQRQVSRSAPSTSAAKSIARSKKGDSEMNSRSGGCSKVKLAVKSKRDGEEQSCASRAQSSQRSSFPLSAPSAGARREAKASSDGDDDEHDGLRRRLVGRAAGVTNVKAAQLAAHVASHPFFTSAAQSRASREEIVKAAQTAEGIAATFAARSHDDDDEESEEDREANAKAADFAQRIAASLWARADPD